jgi:PilZ domain-containing protein
METSTEPQPTEAEAKAALRRRHDRRSAAVTALVHSHGRFQTVSILDFSTGGLQLQGAFGVAPADNIEIELLSGHRLPAKVVWSLGSRIGAQFVPVLEPDCPAILALQRTVAGASSGTAASGAK